MSRTLNQNAMIDIKNLTFQYKKNQPLFEDFNLTLQQGSIVGLLGKNGAGKSTLLSLIAGLIPSSKGSLCVNGYEPFVRNPNFLANVSLVPEEFGFPSVSIECYVKAFAPMYPSFDMDKLKKIMEEFELNSRKKLNQLSHGQR